MLSNLTKQQKIIYAIVAVVVVTAISVGTVFLIRSINNDTSQKKVIPTAETADSLKTQAIEANKTNATDKAKALFQEAKQQYQELGDTNNVIDTEAQLYLIEHQYSPSP